MTAKEYLSQIARAERRINMLKGELEDLHRQFYPSSPDYASDHVQSSHDPDKMGALVAKTDAVERRIVDWIDRLIDLKAEISKQIMEMPNTRTAEILHCRYVLLLKWEEIAVRTNTDLRWVYRLHGQGLVEFERQFLGTPLKATKHM